MNNRASVEFFVCGALMLVFGAGFRSYGGPPLGLQVGLAACVVVAGLFLRTGSEAARTVGIVVLAAVVAVGGFSTFTGSYMAGTIVALITLIRMLSSGAGTGSSGGLPADPRGGQQYGQVPGYGNAGSPQPYGPYDAPPASYPPPYSGQPQAAQPYAGDPRFGPPDPAPTASPAPAGPPAWPAPSGPADG